MRAKQEKWDRFIFSAFLVSLYHLSLTVRNILWNLMHYESKGDIIARDEKSKTVPFNSYAGCCI